MQTRWPTTVANTSTHYGYGSVNITAWRCKCKRVCDSCRSPLPGVKYDLLFHSRHNDRDRTVQVGHEMSLDFKRTNKYWKLLLERILALLFICIVTNWTCSIVECLWTQNALSRHYHKMYMGFQPAGGGSFLEGISGFRGDWDRRLADFNCWNIYQQTYLKYYSSRCLARP